MEGLEHGQQENAICKDVEFDKKEQDEELQSSAVDEVQERTIGRAKRSKTMYLLKNADILANWGLRDKSSDTPPFMPAKDRRSLKTSSAAQPTSSKSTKCDSSASHLEDPDSDGASEPAGKSNMLQLKEKLKTHTSQQCFIQDLKDQNMDETAKKPEEYLASDVKELPQSAFVNNGLEVMSSYSDPVSTDQQGAVETALMDVHLTVQTSNRAENVPFVCLTSKLNGKAILGYPLEIRELTSSCKTLLPRNGSAACKLVDDEGSGSHKLVWRTSKRTPVCYVTNSLSSSISKKSQGWQASNHAEDLNPCAKVDNLLVKDQSFKKLLKSSKQSKEAEASQSRACVPVELIFGKVIAAVAQVHH